MKVKRVRITVEWVDYNGLTPPTEVSIECNSIAEATMDWRGGVLWFGVDAVKDVTISGPAIPQGGGG